MDYKAIIHQIRSKEYHPVYMLHGEEPYFIDEITRVVENEILTEGEKSFNMTVLYGKDADSREVVDAARRYPMMADKQIVIIKEAQRMDTLPNLLSYIEKPQPSTILLIAHKHKKLDMRTAFAKSINKHALVYESKPIYDNQVGAWTTAYLKDHHLKIDHEAADLITTYLGTDLGKIANELDKLAINLKKGATVSPQEVRDNIGISKDYNVFELQRAIGSKQITQINRIIFYFADNPKNHPFVLTISNLFSFFSKIYMLHFLSSSADADAARILGVSPFFLKDYRIAARNFPLPKTQQVISLLKEYDLKSKGVDSDGVEEGELLKEMIFKLTM